MTYITLSELIAFCTMIFTIVNTIVAIICIILNDKKR